MFEPIPSLTVVWVLIKKQNEFNVNYILKMNGECKVEQQRNQEWENRGEGGGKKWMLIRGLCCVHASFQLKHFLPLSQPHFHLSSLFSHYFSPYMYICRSPSANISVTSFLCRRHTVWVCKYGKIETSALLTHTHTFCLHTTKVVEVRLCTLLIFRMSKTTVNAIISSIQYIIHMT